MLYPASLGVASVGPPRGFHPEIGNLGYDFVCSFSASTSKRPCYVFRNPYRSGESSSSDWDVDPGVTVGEAAAQAHLSKEAYVK